MSHKCLLSFAILLTLALSEPAAAQGQSPAQAPEPPRHEMGGERVMGTVTSVGVDRFEIKKADGTTATVLVNDQTHYRQQQQEFQLEDLKPGDHIFVRGNLNSDKQFVAAGVVRVTEEQLQRFQAGGGPGPGGGPGGPGGGWGQSGGDRAGGEIVSIDQNQIKVRGRQGERIIVVNDQTTFTKQGQAIALKDLKVGDRIFAVGKEEKGQFVATQVRTGGMRMEHEGGWQPH
jgi:preprotein translocase subunit YajC